MGETPYGTTDFSAAGSSPFGNLGVVSITDLLLLGLARRTAAALTIVPDEDRTIVRYEQGGATLDLAAMHVAIGDAVVARLSIIAGLDLAAEREQVGRLRIEANGRQMELLLLVWRVVSGLAAEVRRIAGAGARPSVGTGTLAAGTEFGSYRVTGMLGKGGQGIVYRAEHLILEKPVAIKVLHGWVARDPVLAAQFVIEARAACRARHPGIIDVTDFGNLPDGRSYYVMELVDAATLDVVLARQGPFDIARALGIASQIGEALRAAAVYGVVHCDLKPANIFIEADDRVRLGDFGLARIRRLDSADEEPRRVIVGTAHYMAPELIDGIQPDARTDIYAVGCVLFQMLTGRVPYQGTVPLEVLRLHAVDPIPELVAPDGAMPAAVERLVRRALAKEPEARYQSPDELLADLELARQVVARGDWRRWLPP